MIQHLAMFDWNDDVTDDEVAALTADLREMADRLPVLLSYACGPALGLRPGGPDYAVSAVLASAGDLDAYLDSAEHQAVYERHLGRMIRDRRAAQIEIDDPAPEA